MTIILQGSFGLLLPRDSFDLTGTGVFYKRADHSHGSVIGRRGLRSLIIEVRADEADLCADQVRLPETSFLDGGPSAMSLARDIALNYAAQDAAAEVVLEGLCLELLGGMIRSGLAKREKAPPRWLKRAIDFLEDCYSERISLRDVACAVEIDRAHLAHSFRRYYGCSVGEYLRRIRLKHAARELRETDRSLSDIAYRAGFADQPHFSRSFKRVLGLTPRQYRQSAKGRDRGESV